MFFLKLSKAEAKKIEAYRDGSVDGCMCCTNEMLTKSSRNLNTLFICHITQHSPCFAGNFTLVQITTPRNNEPRLLIIFLFIRNPFPAANICQHCACLYPPPPPPYTHTLPNCYDSFPSSGQRSCFLTSS